MVRLRRILALPLLVLIPTVGLSRPVTPALCAPPSPQKGGIEEFSEVDPYTEGDADKLESLGYVRYGPMPFIQGNRTPEVEETLGGVPILWVETEHFRLGSSLTTYRYGSDKVERALIEDELKELKSRLGKFKAPKKALDPWLRLHLYAMRLEALYDEFCEEFGLEPSDFAAEEPYLGQPDKFLVLVTERRSSFGRFCNRYLKVDEDHSFRYHFPDGGAFYGTSAEAWRSNGAGLDSAVHATLRSNLARVFLDAYRRNLGHCPPWFRYGFGHEISRRIDARWTTSIGLESGAARTQDDWEWEPRIRQLVDNEFYVKLPDMLAWTEYEDLSPRDHLIAWSKVDYLLDLKKADLGPLLDALALGPKQPEAVPGEPPPPPVIETPEERMARHTAAFETAAGMTLEKFDKVWAKHVLKQYSKK